MHVLYIKDNIDFIVHVFFFIYTYLLIYFSSYEMGLQNTSSAPAPLSNFATHLWNGLPAPGLKACHCLHLLPPASFLCPLLCYAHLNCAQRLLSPTDGTEVCTATPAVCPSRCSALNIAAAAVFLCFCSRQTPAGARQAVGKTRAKGFND